MKTALVFGADSVYVGGKDYSLRAFAGNLDLDEIRQGLAFARTRGQKVYITVNILARNRDLKDMPSYLEALADIGVDGIIVSDLGVLRLAKQYAPDIPLTISTQANISNYEAAAFYRDLGATRLVLARELSLEEIADIKERVAAEIEVFIHGAMCVSYSGRCLLSHYMTGRSGNRGECAHPCRYKYTLMEEKRPGQYFPIEEDERGSYILNSCDLCLIEYLPELIEIGIDAFKVEGRMKSPLYVASVAGVYRQAIDKFVHSLKPFAESEKENWIKELAKTATRPFANGFVAGDHPDLQDIYKDKPPERAAFCGIVKGWDQENLRAEVEQRGNFGPGDRLEFLLPGNRIKPVDLESLYDAEGNLVDRARHAQQVVYIPCEESIPVCSILRRLENRDE